MIFIPLNQFKEIIFVALLLSQSQFIFKKKRKEYFSFLYISNNVMKIERDLVIYIFFLLILEYFCFFRKKLINIFYFL